MVAGCGDGVTSSTGPPMEFATPPRGRLLLDTNYPAAINMAIDELLLEDAATQGIMTLRFYGWDQASVSLGYFQRLADRQQHGTSRHCPLVRRASGGGAIVHDTPDHDLTYSLAVPNVPRHRDAQLSLYQIFHQTMVAMLQVSAIAAHQSDQDPLPNTTSVSTSKPFLCFLRHTQGDVLVNDAKVLGSAQRRQATAVLQHGSLLLRRSPAAPELPGLVQLAPEASTYSAGWVRQQWLERLIQSWPVGWETAMLAESDWNRVRKKVDSKYDHFSWNARR